MATRAGKGDNIGVGVAIEMNVVGAAKAAEDMKRANDSIDRALNKTRNAIIDHDNKLANLNRRYKEGEITKREYAQLFNKLKFQENQRIERLERERRAVLGLDREESLLHRKRMQRARMAGMAASGVSGLGMGGRAAGAARFLGGVAGLGAGAAGVGLGFTGLALIKESISAYADLEQNVASLQVLFGKETGTRLTDQFRQLAATTALTNNQLIENAKTWASYGLTTEGLTDRLRRLGTVAGGNSEKFRALTIAFAQVNAQGKLMGQEKNQLINAGMSLQAVADAAGISMDEFADAMKNGEIRAEHLNQALVNITSEGGLFAGYLEAQAETIRGKMTLLTSAWEEFLQALGKAEEGPAGDFLDKLILATRTAKDLVPVTEQLNISSILGGDLVGGNVGGMTASIMNILSGKLGEEAVRAGDVGAFSEAVGQGISLSIGKFLEAGTGIEAGSLFSSVSSYFAGLTPKVEEESTEKRDAAQAKVDAIYAEEDKKRLEERRRLEKAMLDDIAANWDATQEEFANVISNIAKDSPIFEKAMTMFSERFFKQGGAGFVGPMPADRAIEEETQRRIDARKEAMQFEIDLMEASITTAEKSFDKEMELLKLKEQEVAERLSIDRKLAAGPAQKDAMFTGGSVEEFMFLRRQTQENETARAVKEAEDRAAEQRRQIEADRKTADQNRDNAITELKTAINDLATKISNLD